MPPFGGRRQRPRLGAALLLVARADIPGDVQLLAAIARVLLVVRHRRGGGGGGDRALARRGWRRGERLRPLTLAGVPLVLLALAGAPRLVVTAALFGHPVRVLLGAAARVLLLDAAAVLRLEPLALAALGFGALILRAHRRFGLLATVIDLVLLGARLLLEHVALDVGAFAAHLDIDGARAPLRAGELQLALGLAPQGDLARRAVAIGVAPVAAAQVREQLEFGVVADARVRTRHLDARLVELRQQPVHRHLENLGKLGNAHFGHRLEPSSCQLPASNHGARAVMMSLAALSAARPSMSASSSTDCSARSSRVRTPRRARVSARSGLMPSSSSRSSAGID